jgi:hypothetical protein
MRFGLLNRNLDYDFITTMKTKIKLILLTALPTTIFWAAAIAAVLYVCNVEKGPLPMGEFYFSPAGKEPILVTTWVHSHDPNSVIWQPHGGDYLVQLLSSNATDSATTVLYSHTSRPPERIQFQTVLIEPHTNK